MHTFKCLGARGLFGSTTSTMPAWIITPMIKDRLLVLSNGVVFWVWRWPHCKIVLIGAPDHPEPDSTTSYFRPKGQHDFEISVIQS